MCNKYSLATKKHSRKYFCSECNILLAIHDSYNMNIRLIVKPETQTMFMTLPTSVKFNEV